MAATNLVELMDFEGNFEVAAQGVVVANGITGYITQTNIQADLINAGISFVAGPALDELTELPKPSWWGADDPPPQDYFRYPGTLTFRVEVPRDDNGATISGVETMLEQIRGQLRAAFMRVCEPFDATNLPLYKVSDIRPDGAAIGSSGAPRNLDFCVCRFAVTFEIKPDAWPVWVEVGP